MYGKVNNNIVAMKWKFFFFFPANSVGVSPVFSLFPLVLFSGLRRPSFLKFKKKKRGGEEKGEWGGEASGTSFPIAQCETAESVLGHRGRGSAFNIQIKTCQFNH